LINAARLIENEEHLGPAETTDRVGLSACIGEDLASIGRPKALGRIEANPRRIAKPRTELARRQFRLLDQPLPASPAPTGPQILGSDLRSKDDLDMLDLRGHQYDARAASRSPKPECDSGSAAALAGFVAGGDRNRGVFGRQRLHPFGLEFPRIEVKDLAR